MITHITCPIMLLLLSLVPSVFAETIRQLSADDTDIITPVHQNGYCAMYGTGGKKSFFGADLPKPNNTKAPVLSLTDQSLLASICGESWEGLHTACCDTSQLNNLKANLQKAEPLISSCPACRENFYQLWCHFTCSPDQSTFVNITKLGTSISGGDIVTEGTSDSRRSIMGHVMCVIIV